MEWSKEKSFFIFWKYFRDTIALHCDFLFQNQNKVLGGCDGLFSICGKVSQDCDYLFQNQNKVLGGCDALFSIYGKVSQGCDNMFLL